MKSESLQKICEALLGRPYLLGACGEGPLGRYDQFPFYRFDAFDCVTFVNTVLMLLFSQNQREWESRWLGLNYLAEEACFLQRLHFVELDWNRKQDAMQYSLDQTLQFRNEKGEPCACLAQCLLEKARWFSFRGVEQIRLPGASVSLREARLHELHTKGQEFVDEPCDLWYLPWDVLFTKGEPVSSLWDQFPAQAVIEMVRPNWQIRDKIGTCLNISHVGFLLRAQRHFYFYHASSSQAKVVKVPFEDYLKEFIQSDTLKGIYVRKIQI